MGWVHDITRAVWKQPGRVRPWLCGLCIVLAVGVAGASTRVEARGKAPLPTLTKAGDVHGLTLAEARQAYPVCLRAVVTYYDPYIDVRHIAMFVHDSSGSIFVSLSSPTEIPMTAGTLVEITGTSGAGDFAPIVNGGSVRTIGASHLPARPPRASLTELLTGKYDGAWVQVEGVVRSVREFGTNVNVAMSLSDGSLYATTIRESGADYRHLVDAKVTIRGNAAPVFNGKLQMIGARLLFPDLKQVTVEDSATADPFQLPIVPTERLLSYTPDISFRRRVRVRGRVSLIWPGRLLCIQDGTHSLCVESTENLGFTEGDVVDIVGFPEIGGLTPTLADTVARSVAHAGKLPALPVTAEQAIGGDYDNRLVRIEGKVIGRDRASKDPTMVLSAQKFLFQVVLPDRKWGDAGAVWEDGSTVRVTGICSVQITGAGDLREGLSVPNSFRVLLRSPEDVVVVHRPSWWTAEHLLPLLAAVLAIALCVLGWVMMLRNRIAEQAKVIQEQNVIFRGLSFKDGLTGIPNRRTFDVTLQAEFDRCSRLMTPISLLLIDIDHFKALNDEYGHQQGDECLKRIGRALTAVPLRDLDLVARYGGEEFAVILPECDATGAFKVAEAMHAAVLDLRIAHYASTTNGFVSVSIGTATLRPRCGGESRFLVSMADRALYQSKFLGRNRTSAAAECGSFADLQLESL